ncbi:undecaprenyl-diphosphatase UppP [Aureispira]|nr:undecaprenyl-diphosphatase UppP [Aureispira sp.]
MDWLAALILGIIQGLTEYLPVSSSGHIELGKYLMDVTIEENTTFTVVLHFATVLSTIVVFWKDIADILKGLFQFKNNDAFRFSVKVVLSMIPAAVLGIVFNDQIESLFNGNILLVGLMLWLTALLLFFAERDKTKSLNSDVQQGSVSVKEQFNHVSYLNAIWIGIAQAIAILPGVSRSGATISTAILLNVNRSEAARFSFLMVIPLIMGKVAKDLLDGKFNMQNDETFNMLVGFIAAFLVGIIACKWMLNLVKNGKLVYFSVYCFIVGAIAVVFSFI